MRVERLFFSALAASSLLAVGIGHAATIGVDAGSPAIYDTIATPSTIGIQGFELFATYPAATPGATGSRGTDVISLPAYVASVVTAGNYYFASPYSDINVGPTGYATGVTYVGPSGGTIATITLQNSGLPAGGFKLGLLGDNVDGPGRGISLSVNGVPQAQVGSVETNRFYFYDVTNLQPSDVITITGVAGNNSATIGGITFDALPEPASLSLLLPGAASILGRRKRLA